MTAGAADLTEANDLHIEKGATWRIELLYKTESGNAVDLSNHSARMEVRASPTSGTILDELTTDNGRISIDGPNGKITLELTPTETSNIDWDWSVYDLEIENDNDATDVERLLEGKIQAKEEVTRG